VSEKPAYAALDPAQREHLARSSWMTPDMCGCRARPDGSRFYVCRRRACDAEAKVCGGNCPECFRERMERARLLGDTEVVVLCGSTRFKAEFERETRRLGLEGKIVLSVSMFGHSGDLTPEQCTDGHPTKTALDELHKRKIDMAHRVLVINPGGYIGTSTHSEIEYAEWWEKPVEYLVPLPDKPEAGESRG
jgi:hypothetical protein